MGMAPRCFLPRLSILTLLGCSACSQADLQPPPRFSSISFDELKQGVSRARGLTFTQDVGLETKPAAELQATLQESFSEKNSDLSGLARVYSRLGLLPEKTDLAKGLLQLHFWREGVRYDPLKNTIVVPEEPLEPNRAILRAPFPDHDLVTRALVAHALTHALEEQNFHWQGRLRYATLDSRLALRAVQEGDATLVWLAQLIGDPKEKPQQFVEGLKNIARSGSRVDSELSDLPELLRQKLAFPYIWGSQFVMWAYFLKGSDGVNELFSRPPLSTEQVLHPEKYYGKRDDPLQVNPWNLLRQFGGRIMVDETLGEFLIQFLLGRTLSVREAAQAAAGWGGDRLLAFEQEGKPVLVWVTAWDDRKEALEFFSSYRKALEKSHQQSFEPVSGDPEALTMASQSGQAVFLQIRENCVFFLDGMSPAASLETAGRLWNDLDIRSEPTGLPLDLANRSVPHSKR